jgi:hypothetical protein
MPKTFIKAAIIMAAITLGLVGSAGAYVWQCNPATGKYYALTNASTTWTGCEAEAVAAGGHLVTINSLTEETWLQTNIGTGVYWIGLTRPTTNLNWYWISNGEPATYLHFDGPEPNNAETSEYYVVMNFTGDTGTFHWDDQVNAGFNSPHQGIIEVSVNPNSRSIPGILTLLLLN